MPSKSRYTSQTRASPCRAPENVTGSKAALKSKSASGASAGYRPIFLAKSTTSGEYMTFFGSFWSNVVVLAWLACARTAPSGTFCATHTAPFSNLPLPMSSITQASSPSMHEKDSPSLA